MRLSVFCIALFSALQASRLVAPSENVCETLPDAQATSEEMLEPGTTLSSSSHDLAVAPQYEGASQITNLPHQVILIINGYLSLNKGICLAAALAGSHPDVLNSMPLQCLPGFALWGARAPLRLARCKSIIRHLTPLRQMILVSTLFMTAGERGALKIAEYADSDMPELPPHEQSGTASYTAAMLYGGNRIHSNLPQSQPTATGSTKRARRRARYLQKKNKRQARQISNRQSMLHACSSALKLFTCGSAKYPEVFTAAVVSANTIKALWKSGWIGRFGDESMPDRQTRNLASANHCFSVCLNGLDIQKLQLCERKHYDASDTMIAGKEPSMAPVFLSEIKAGDDITSDFIPSEISPVGHDGTLCMQMRLTVYNCQTILDALGCRIHTPHIQQLSVFAVKTFDSILHAQGEHGLQSVFNLTSVNTRLCNAALFTALGIRSSGTRSSVEFLRMLDFQLTRSECRQSCGDLIKTLSSLSRPDPYYQLMYAVLNARPDTGLETAKQHIRDNATVILRDLQQRQVSASNDVAIALTVAIFLSRRCPEESLALFLYLSRQAPQYGLLISEKIALAFGIEALSSERYIAQVGMASALADAHYYSRPRDGQGSIFLGNRNSAQTEADRRSAISIFNGMRSKYRGSAREDLAAMIKRGCPRAPIFYTAMELGTDDLPTCFTLDLNVMTTHINSRVRNVYKQAIEDMYRSALRVVPNGATWPYDIVIELAKRQIEAAKSNTARHRAYMAAMAALAGAHLGFMAEHFCCIHVPIIMALWETYRAHRVFLDDTHLELSDADKQSLQKFRVVAASARAMVVSTNAAQ